MNVGERLYEEIRAKSKVVNLDYKQIKTLRKCSSLAELNEWFNLQEYNVEAENDRVEEYSDAIVEIIHRNSDAVKAFRFTNKMQAILWAILGVISVVSWLLQIFKD